VSTYLREVGHYGGNGNECADVWGLQQARDVVTMVRGEHNGWLVSLREKLGRGEQMLGPLLWR
jgi:hypothetical protein